MEVWLEEIIPLLLITLRITGFMVAAPITGSRYIPGLIKGTVSLLLGYILWPVVQAGPVPATLGGVVGAAVSEVAVGLLLGFCGNIIMAAIETAGYLVDMKIGFGMANVVNPHFGQASPILGIFKYLLVMLIFLGIDGHHILVRALHGLSNWFLPALQRYRRVGSDRAWARPRCLRSPWCCHVLFGPPP